jgi:hypothetical protein
LFFSLRQIQLLCVMTLFIWTEKNVLWINIHHFCIGDIINFQMISRSEIQHFKLSINEATRMFLYNQIISRTYNPKASRTYTVLFHNLPAKFKMAAFKHQVLQPINLWKRCLPLLNTLSFLPSPSILCVNAWNRVIKSLNVVHTEIFPNVFDGRWQFIGSVQYFNSLLQSYFQF